jgi:rhamnogalacturonyl hydrolase YesR
MITPFFLGLSRLARRALGGFPAWSWLVCASSVLAANFEVSESDGLLICRGDLSGVTVNATTGRLEGFASRLSVDDPWTESQLQLEGRQRDSNSVLQSTADGEVTVQTCELGENLLVKVSSRLDGIYWNLWYALRIGDPVIEGGRFAYGEEKSVRLRGVGLASVFPEGSAATSTEANYTDLGGSFVGGEVAWSEDGADLSLYYSNMRNHTVEVSTEENGLTLWNRASLTEWGTRIDYRRFALALSGAEGAEAYARLKVNDHEMTTVERVGSWFVREKNASGAVRDWFNEANHQNSFIPGTGSPSRTNLAGFWRDDWTTGSLLRQVKMTYDLSGDVFYLMRLIDLMDYQIDRELGLIKSQWGLNNGWQENYPFGRIEAAIDVYEITGWESYRDVAVDSLNWFLEFEEFEPGAGHSTDYNDDYLDMAYCFEGFYRADAYNGNKWRQKINDYWRNIDFVTWDSVGKLYGHNLGGGRTDHWARGHGWWFCAFPNVMDFYDGRDIETLRTHHREAAANLIRLQDGTWHRTVDKASTFLDSSAGSLIAAGLLQSALRGDFGVEVLKASFDAIETLYEDELKSDGTITGTDRGATSRSDDPFPYTQEGFIRFAWELDVGEILDPADRAELHGSLADGVLVLGAGGTLTDSDGRTLTVDGRVALSDLQADSGFFRLTGEGTRTISLNGYSPDSWFTLMDSDGTTMALKTDASGTLSATLNLGGQHALSAVERASGAIWADRIVWEGGVFEVPGFGWAIESHFPWVWMEHAGWCWVQRQGDEKSYWFYRYDEQAWQWTHPEWGGWYYDHTSASWRQLSVNAVTD